MDAISNILVGFRRTEKTAAIFFHMEKTYHKVNRENTLKQLENQGIQGRMREFIIELIGETCIKVKVQEYISQSKKTGFGIPQGEDATFSPSKTVSMTFRKRNEEPKEILLRNQIIKKVPRF